MPQVPPCLIKRVSRKIHCTNSPPHGASQSAFLAGDTYKIALPDQKDTGSNPSPLCPSSVNLRNLPAQLTYTKASVSPSLKGEAIKQ